MILKKRKPQDIENWIFVSATCTYFHLFKMCFYLTLVEYENDKILKERPEPLIIIHLCSDEDGILESDSRMQT